MYFPGSPPCCWSRAVWLGPAGAMGDADDRRSLVSGGDFSDSWGDVRSICWLPGGFAVVLHAAVAPFALTQLSEISHFYSAEVILIWTWRAISENAPMAMGAWNGRGGRICRDHVARVDRDLLRVCRSGVAIVAGNMRHRGESCWLQVPARDYCHSRTLSRRA